ELLVVLVPRRLLVRQPPPRLIGVLGVGRVIVLRLLRRGIDGRRRGVRRRLDVLGRRHRGPIGGGGGGRPVLRRRLHRSGRVRGRIARPQLRPLPLRPAVVKARVAVVRGDRRALLQALGRGVLLLRLLLVRLRVRRLDVVLLLRLRRLLRDLAGRRRP